MTRGRLLFCFLALMAGFVASAIAQEHAKSEKTSSTSTVAPLLPVSPAPTHEASSPTPNAATDERIARVEGEKRFRANCGRCHQPPHKFPPRVMATVIRHMRVRAMITEEDMRLILRYMTQ